MRKVLFALFLMLCAFPLAAQNTTVSSTGVVDPDGTTWAYGTWNLSFRPNPNYPNIGQYKIGGSPLSPSVINQNGTMSSSGAFSFVVYQSSSITPSGSSWTLQVCPLATASCGTYTFGTSTSTLNVTSIVNGIIQAPRFNAVAGAYGYADIEAVISIPQGGTYYNNGASCQRYYNSVTLTWACGSGSGSINLANGIIVGTGTGSSNTAATASNVISLFSSCSGTQYLGADGACHTSSGGNLPIPTQAPSAVIQRTAGSNTAISDPLGNGIFDNGLQMDSEAGLNGLNGIETFCDSNCLGYGLVGSSALNTSPGWPAILANDIGGGVLYNYGQSGDAVAGGATKLVGQIGTITANSNPIVIFDDGSNVARFLNTSAAWTTAFENSVYSAATWATIPTTNKILNSAWAQTGTWTTQQSNIRSDTTLGSGGSWFQLNDVITESCNPTGTGLSYTVTGIYTEPYLGTIGGTNSGNTPGTTTVALTGGSGTGATAVVVVSSGGVVTSVTPVSGTGNGYFIGDVLTPSGTNATYTVGTIAGPITASSFSGFGSSCSNLGSNITYPTTRTSTYGSGATLISSFGSIQPLVSMTSGNTLLSQLINVPTSGFFYVHYSQWAGASGTAQVTVDASATPLVDSITSSSTLNGQYDVTNNTNCINTLGISYVGTSPSGLCTVGTSPGASNISVARFSTTPGYHTITITQLTNGQFGVIGVSAADTSHDRGAGSPNIMLTAVRPQGGNANASYIAYYSGLIQQVQQTLSTVDGLNVGYVALPLNYTADFLSAQTGTITAASGNGTTTTLTMNAILGNPYFQNWTGTIAGLTGGCSGLNGAATVSALGTLTSFTILNSYSGTCTGQTGTFTPSASQSVNSCIANTANGTQILHMSGGCGHVHTAGFIEAALKAFGFASTTNVVAAGFTANVKTSGALGAGVNCNGLSLGSTTAFNAGCWAYEKLSDGNAAGMTFFSPGNTQYGGPTPSIGYMGLVKASGIGLCFGDYTATANIFPSSLSALTCQSSFYLGNFYLNGSAAGSSTGSNPSSNQLLYATVQNIGTASVTAWQVTSPNTVFTATNSFATGQYVALGSFGTTTAFNGTWNKITAATGSTFTVGTTFGLSNSSSTESGTADNYASAQVSQRLYSSASGSTASPRFLTQFGAQQITGAPLVDLFNNSGGGLRINLNTIANIGAFVQTLALPSLSSSFTTTMPSAAGSIPAITGSVTTGHIATFVSTGTASNIQDGGVVPTGTVTSVSTTSPITGGPITSTGTLACATCVVSSSPGVGIAHFAGSTQTVTSSAVNLSNSDVTGNLPHANIAATAVTPGSYTNTNLTVAADGSITAASNGTGGGGVSSFSGDGTLISNSSSTGAITATLATAGANTIWGNATLSTAAPNYYAFNATNFPTAAFLATAQTFTATQTFGTIQASNITGLTSTTPLGFNNASPLNMFDFVGSVGMLGSGPTSSTTSNGAFTSSATSLTVVSTTGYPSKGYIEIGNSNFSPEVLSYTGTTSTTFTGLTRSLCNTTASSSQATGTLVTLASFIMFDANNKCKMIAFWNAGILLDPGGSPNNYLLGPAVTGGSVASSAFTSATYYVGANGNLASLTASGTGVKFANTGSTTIFTVDGSGNGTLVGSSTAASYATATNCANGASPAVCSAAPDGAVAMPTGVNPTLVVNTTAVTANSRIFLTVDDSVTIASTTCNSTLATLVGGIAVTARTAGTSFTVSYSGTISTNPLCFVYKIEN